MRFKVSSATGSHKSVETQSINIRWFVFHPRQYQSLKSRSSRTSARAPTP
jgi:hypothetical protein